MAIYIQESFGFKESRIPESNYSVDLKEGVAYNTISNNSLMVDVEGIHVGMTRNLNFYTDNALKTSVPKWTKPYNRPVILYHEDEKGKIIGRIRSVEHTDVNTRSNTPALVFTINVADKEAMEQMESGIHSTPSIGVAATEAYCSICNQNIAAEGECEHKKGIYYEGKQCYWIIEAIEPKELSYVIVPSDIYAHNIRIYRPELKKLNESEQIEVLKLNESENQIINETLDEKEIPLELETQAAEDQVNEVPAEEVKSEETLEEVKTKLEEALTLVNTQTEEIATLKTTIENLGAELQTKINDMAALKSEIENAKTEAETAKSDKALEVATRESAETEIAALKSEFREFMTNTLIKLNEGLIEKDVALVEKVDAMNSTDLKESIDGLFAKLQESATKKVIENIEKPKNPTIIQESQNKNVNKKSVNSNIGLDMTLEKLLSNLMGPSK